MENSLVTVDRRKRVTAKVTLFNPVCYYSKYGIVKVEKVKIIDDVIVEIEDRCYVCANKLFLPIKEKFEEIQNDTIK